MKTIDILIILTITGLALLAFVAASVSAFWGCSKQEKVKPSGPVPLQPARNINVGANWKNPAPNSYNPTFLNVVDNGGNEITITMTYPDGKSMALLHPLKITERSPSKFVASYSDGAPTSTKPSFSAHFETQRNGDGAIFSQSLLYESGGGNTSEAFFQRE